MFKLFVVLSVALTLRSVESYCSSDESRLLSVAKSDSQGKSPDGYCYSHVADYIDAVGYGGINKNGFDDAIPSAYWSYAYQFAEYLNTGSNAADLCLENVQSKYSNNPYKAPSGTIVVVRAGTPGTANPVAGDIAVVGDGDHFYNGGEMSYGGSQNFPSNNNYVLGIYAPTACCGSCSGGGGGCSSDCSTCLHYGGGKGCLDRCDGCSDACITCINNGGGSACESRCAASSQLFSVMTNSSDAARQNNFNGRVGYGYSSSYRSTGSGASTCNDIKDEKTCMSSSEGTEKCSWCTSGAVGASCNKESDAKSLPSSVFECEFQ